MPRGGQTLDYYKQNFEVFDPSRNLMAQNWITTPNEDSQNPYWLIKRNASVNNDHFFKGKYIDSIETKRYISNRFHTLINFTRTYNSKKTKKQKITWKLI